MTEIIENDTMEILIKFKYVNINKNIVKMKGTR